MQGNQSRSPIERLRKVNQKTDSFPVGALNLDRSVAGHHYDLLSTYDEIRTVLSGFLGAGTVAPDDVQQ
jgi:hypothetical protein